VELMWGSGLITGQRSLKVIESGTIR